MKDLIWLIFITAVELLRKQELGSKAGESVDTTAELLKIVRAGAAAYRQQTGKDLDPALIKPLEPLP